MNLSKKLKPIGDIITLYQNLLDKLGFSGSEPYKDKFITDLIKDLENSAKLDKILDFIQNAAFDKNNTEKNLEEIFSGYEKIQDLINRLHNAEDIFADYENKSTISSSVSLSMTSSFTEELSVVSGNLSNNMAHLNNVIRALELDDLFSSKVITVVDVKKMDKLADVYLSFVKKNRGSNVINLYTSSLHQALDKIVGTKDSRSIVIYIGELLEKVKDEILETDEYKSRTQAYNKKNISANTVQFLMQKHDLVPASEYTSIDQILSKIGIAKVSGSTIAGKLQNACKTLGSASKKYGFVVINKISKKPFRHTIDPLVSKKYIYKYNIMDSALSGINEKTIKRTNTIISLQQDGVKDHIEIINPGFTNKTENYYYIIQSLDGIGYEILIPWGFEEDRFNVPEALIDFKNPVSSRVEKYNSILESELIQHLQEPMTPAMGSRIEMKMEESYWNGIVGKIKNTIMPEYKDEFLKSKDKSVTLNRVGNIIFDNKMIDKLLEKITSVAKEDMVNQTGKVPHDEIARDQYDNELNASFWSEMDNIKRKLPSRMNDIWKEEMEPKIAKRLSKNIKLTHSNINTVMEFLSHLLTDTLRIYINRRSGIFITIRNKLDLLSKTLYLA